MPERLRRCFQADSQRLAGHAPHSIVRAGTLGGISVFASESSQLVVDLDGYFAAPASGGLSLYPTAPCRVIGTHQNGGQPFQGEMTVNIVGSVCAPPADAQAYVLNATVVPPGRCTI